MWAGTVRLGLTTPHSTGARAISSGNELFAEEGVWSARDTPQELVLVMLPLPQPELTEVEVPPQ